MRWIIILLAVCPVLWGGLVEASMVVKLDTEALVKTAEVIVMGKVQFQPKPYQDAKGTILSRVTVAVDQFLKAPQSMQDSKMIELVQLGGTYDGKTLTVAGMPSFKLSERVILFLRKNPHTAAYDVVGLAQGKYEIRTEKLSGRDYIVRDTSGLTFVSTQKPQTGQQKPVQEEEKHDHDHGSIEKVYLDDFIREIEAYQNPEKLGSQMIIQKKQ